VRPRARIGGTGGLPCFTAVATTKDGKPFSLPLNLGAYSAMVPTR
jgi:hypothetical protein